MLLTLSLKDIAEKAIRIVGYDASISVDLYSFKIIDNKTNKVLIKRVFEDSYTYYFIDPIPFHHSKYMMDCLDFDVESELLEKQLDLYQADKDLPKCVHVGGYTIIVEV